MPLQHAAVFQALDVKALEIQACFIALALDPGERIEGRERSESSWIKSWHDGKILTNFAFGRSYVIGKKKTPLACATLPSAEPDLFLAKPSRQNR